MKFAVGQTITLGGIRYRIRDFLGSGAVAEVYCIVPEDFPDVEVVLKLVREDMGSDVLRIEGLRREAEVLAILNQAEDPRWPSQGSFAARLQRARESALQRRIVALLDSGEIAPQQPFVIQEKAPPIFERFPVDTLAAERRMLRVAHAIASVIALAHRCGLTLKDFEPPTKEDRIRLRWLDEEQFELKIIDWDITGGPEDAAQDLFFFGRHLYAMMTGFQLKLDQSGQPPAVLGSGLAAWERLTEGTRRILQRLLHRDPRRRYARAEDLETDLRWWLSILDQVEQPNVLNQFQDRLWRARIEERHDRALALADLALRLNPPPAVRQTLESAAQQAREELEKEIWFPIAFARGTLLTGAYSRAAEEFEQQLRALPPESEAARLARLYQQLARAGALLKSAYAGADVRSTLEWESLNRAVAELTQRRWSEAQIELRRVVQIRPEAEEWIPVKGLMNVARAGLLLQEASELAARAEPRRADADRSDWMDTEKEHIRQLEIAVGKLEEARQLAPQEPEFGERLRAEQARLRLRQEMLARYEDVQKFIQQGEQAEQEGREAESAGNPAVAAEQYAQASQAFENAIGELQTILQTDSSQYRAQLLLARFQPRYQEAKKKHEETESRAKTVRQAEEERRQAESLLRQGAYSEALVHARRAAALLPDLEEVQNTLHWAEAGARLERQAEGYLDAARQLFALRNLEEAEKPLGILRSWMGSPFQRLPGGENLPALIASQPFQLKDEFRDILAQLESLVRYVKEQRSRIADARSRGDHRVTKSALEALAKKLQEHGYELAEDEQKWLEEANTRIRILDEIEKSLTGKPSLPDLQGMMERLQEDPSERANRLREEIGRTWLRLLESEALDIETFCQSVIRGSYWLKNLSVAGVMEELCRWVEEAQPVQTLLDLESGMQYPYWFEKTDTLNSNLLRLEAYLENLTSEEKWPLIRQQAGIWRRLSDWVEGWRKCNIGFLSDYLKEKLEDARKRAQARQYEEALAETQGVWNALPDSFRGALPPDVGERVIVPLIVSLEGRLQAEKELNEIATQLIDHRISFTEAAERAQGLHLPDHPDVPADDLRARVADLKAAAEIETSLQKEPADPDYAQAIYELHQQLGRDLPTLQQPEGLRRRVDRLKETAQETIARWAAALCRKLEEEAGNLPQRAQPDFSTVLGLYWQARWLEQFVSGNRKSIRAPENLQGALDSARGTPRTLLNQLAGELLNVQDHFELERITPRLNGLAELNQGLVRLPEALSLPPLPEGARYAPLEPSVPADALDGLIRELEYLLSLSDGNNRFQPAEEAEPGPNGRERFQQIVRRIREAQEHLDLLQRYWESLGMEKEETSSLAQLEKEIRLQRELADTIGEALEQDPITALSRLDRGTQQQTWQEELERFPLDILVPLRRPLLEALAAFREGWIQELGGQISKILDNPPATAAAELHKVLLQPRSRGVAEAIHKAVSSVVDRKAQEALRSKQQDKARVLWKVVMDATQPWAPPTPAAARPPSASAQPPGAGPTSRVKKPRRRSESGEPQ